MSKGADFSLLRVARRRRDAIDDRSKNILDATYRTHGSPDASRGTHRIHNGSPARHGIKLVAAQFASVVVQIGHVTLPFCPGGKTVPAARNHRSTPVCERVM
jgi:hypothetical protein